MAVEIPLRGLGGVAIIDDQDADLILPLNWYAVKSKCLIYARRNSAAPGRETIRMHRFILNAQKGELVDHVDGDTLNNRRSNLRICSLSQSNMNRCGHGRSGYKGIIIDDRRQIFRARIKSNGAVFHGRRRKTAEEAARDYDELARNYHGEFAFLNFPI